MKGKLLVAETNLGEWLRLCVPPLARVMSRPIGVEVAISPIPAALLSEV